MKNSISKIGLAITMLLTITFTNAQIKNAKTETVKIYGNCGMCKTTIEKAANLKNIATVDWNKDTKMATLKYDATKTNQDEILKRVALVGYDSDKFLAPNDVYANLHGCCQYDRSPLASNESTPAINEGTTSTEMEDNKTMSKENNVLNTVFDTYFEVKEALVQTDGVEASKKSATLLTAINAVKMDQLEMDVHMVWMKVTKELKEDAEHIADTKDVTHQRDHFMTLSKNMYDLIKVSKDATPTYYQFCPMANKGKGANWLSKDSSIKNPYYGAQMLSCGKTVETIK
jgi:copper chaperone CopZ